MFTSLPRDKQEIITYRQQIRGWARTSKNKVDKKQALHRHWNVRGKGCGRKLRCESINRVTDMGVFQKGWWPVNTTRMRELKKQKRKTGREEELHSKGWLVRKEDLFAGISILQGWYPNAHGHKVGNEKSVERPNYKHREKAVADGGNILFFSRTRIHTHTHIHTHKHTHYSDIHGLGGKSYNQQGYFCLNGSQGMITELNLMRQRKEADHRTEWITVWVSGNYRRYAPWQY